MVKHFLLDFGCFAAGIHQHVAEQKGWWAEVGNHQRKDPAGCVCLVHHQQKIGTQAHHLHAPTSDSGDKLTLAEVER